jgi:hypothetical protein
MTDQRLERLEFEICDMQELIQALSAQLTKEVIQGAAFKKEKHRGGIFLSIRKKNKGVIR